MEKTTKISVAELATYADVGPGMCVAYACLCLGFWGNSIGLCNSEGFALSMGLVQLGYFVLYLVCGLYFLKKGNQLAGGVYIVFSAVFGAFGGFGNIGSAVCAILEIPFDGTITSLSFVASGLFLLFVLPCLKSASKVDFCIYLAAGLGVTGYGLAGLGVLPSACNLIGGWGVGISGFCAYYSGIAGFLSAAGIILPCGTPFFKLD